MWSRIGTREIYRFEVNELWEVFFFLTNIHSAILALRSAGGADLAEPTTDKFTVVMHGAEDLPVEGNSLAVIKELPYEGLTRFGTG